MTDPTPSPPPADEPATEVNAPQPPAAFAAVTPGQTAESPAPVPPPVAGDPAAQAPPIAPAIAGSSSPFPSDRPEIAVGAAFAGGLVFALILKRLAR